MLTGCLSPLRGSSFLPCVWTACACVRLVLGMRSRRGRTHVEVVSLTLVFLKAFFAVWWFLRAGQRDEAGLRAFGWSFVFCLWNHQTLSLPAWVVLWISTGSLPHPVVSHIGRAGVFVDVFK